ncbi:hypothetical protein Vretimale_15186 [Volvox reticuliferus]|uniref:Peptidase M20 dimerisation domain-containing protein n=2 Tax=Volvox reticuliferus TaxID=1737510 RepID=A0A8J4GQ00_9CHLO|nr:hypothetical protein Vretifemale_5335 [Volvox reticuliferus]GIM11686.1 hypothetical protein Vretimale_15186 [Volvox reticuliferus]
MAVSRLLITIAMCWPALRLAVGETHEPDPFLRRALHLEPNKHLQHLATISDTEGSLARTFFSPAHRRAAEQIKSWMQDIGMQTWIDAVGNVHGRIKASRDGTQAVLLGSHYDTVLDGGAYDGALGIIVGLAAVKGMLLTEMVQRGWLDRLPPQPANDMDGDIVIPPTLASSLLTHGSVHLVAFTDEEGVRFQSTFLGSRAVVGTLLDYNMLASRDRSGKSLEQVLQDEGGVTDPRAEVASLALDPATISEYVEVHIEQGPVLESRGLPLGIVAGIAGQTRLWVQVNGTQGHAGTVPMQNRRDALVAAAELITTLEALCTVPESEGGVPEEENLVCTVGEVKVWPGASNVISGHTGFSVDIRSKTDPVRNEVVRQVLQAVERTCHRRGVHCEVERKHDAEAVLSDPEVLKNMGVAASLAKPLLLAVLTQEEIQRNSGILEGLQSVPVLVSGAGHDAMAIAERIPKMGMMFVRCRGGVSHSPLEYMEPEDVTASAAALAVYLWGRLAGSMEAEWDGAASTAPVDSAASKARDEL